MSCTCYWSCSFLIKPPSWLLSIFRRLSILRGAKEHLCVGPCLTLCLLFPLFHLYDSSLQPHQITCSSLNFSCYFRPHCFCYSFTAPLSRMSLLTFQLIPSWPIHAKLKIFFPMLSEHPLHIFMIVHSLTLYFLFKFLFSSHKSRL